MSPNPDEELDLKVARAIRMFVADASEEEQQLPAIQFINNRDILIARAAIAAHVPDERRMIVEWLRGEDRKANSKRRYLTFAGAADAIEHGEHISGLSVGSGQ